MKWRDIRYNGGHINYEISNTGIVRNKDTKKILKPEITKFGYYRVSMCLGKRNLYYRAFIHKLVAQHFIFKKKGYQYQVNHIDGNKLNNVYTNLEWCNQSENNYHAIRTGLTKIGEDDSRATFTNNEVRQICEYLEDGLKPKQISKLINREDGKTRDKISKIKQRKNWLHISKDYKF